MAPSSQDSEGESCTRRHQCTSSFIQLQSLPKPKQKVNRTPLTAIAHRPSWSLGDMPLLAPVLDDFCCLASTAELKALITSLARSVNSAVMPAAGPKDLSSSDAAGENISARSHNFPS